MSSSPFGKLLRRSKFASYDPSIGQAYTTYGGHAYRGNWGLKRPLPNKRKVGFIHVRSIDSKEQQTEWCSAESSTRWIRRWDETGKKLEIAKMGQWEMRNVNGWCPDTEFSCGPCTDESTVSMINRRLSKVSTLSSKQFKKHLERIRANRSSFRQFIQKEHESQTFSSNKSPIKVFGSGEVDMYSSAQTAPNLVLTKFRKHQVSSGFDSLDLSFPIASVPHLYAALEPTVLSPLQIRYLYGPSSGRIIARNVSPPVRPVAARDTSHRVSLAAVAGILGEMPSHGTGAQTAFNNLRISRVQLYEPPDVVRRQPETAANTVFDSVFIFSSNGETNLTNPYPLGSRDYIGKHPGPTEIIGASDVLSVAADEGRKRVTKNPKFQEQSKDNKSVLMSLGQIMASPSEQHH